MKPKDQAIEVFGNLACFTRPEMKVERFSYPIITPSAARGIYEAIYCKPLEFRWQITRVEMLSPPSYIALRRNEVKEKISVSAVSKMASGKADPTPIWADGDRSLTRADTKGRTQRQTMALKNVRYRLHAEMRPWPQFANRLQALENQFRRRAANGKCFYQPYFGCKEFPAYFELIEPDDPPAETCNLNLDNLGWMLYDIFDLSRTGDCDDSPCISLFKPQVKDGVMIVPEYESDEVRKGMRRER